METQQGLQENKSKLSVGFFFLCLGLLITLITSVVSFLNLVFETLNKRFPDVLNASYQYGYSTYEYEGIRMALATLIIFFPVFLVVSYFWKKFLRGTVGLIDEIIKKWVIYIILFLSAIVTMVDLVVLVRYFVSGEITTRFILKALVALIVAMFVGVNYILELKNKQRVWGFAVAPWAAIKSSVLVVLAIIFSFYVIGSPFNQRLLRLDDRRVGDLQNIQYQVIHYWQQKEKLPADLQELANPFSGWSVPVEPEFEKGRMYEYAVKGPMTFELCATFSLPMPQGWREYGRGGGIMPMGGKVYEDTAYTYPWPGSTNESWDHREGRACFERTIDPDMYPTFPKPEPAGL